MLNSHQSEMCANKARQQYTPMGLFLSFTPIKMKLYKMKVPMKSNIFCITSFFENEFKFANELYTNRIVLCGTVAQLLALLALPPHSKKVMGSICAWGRCWYWGQAPGGH